MNVLKSKQFLIGLTIGVILLMFSALIVYFTGDFNYAIRRFNINIFFRRIHNYFFDIFIVLSDCQERFEIIGAKKAF